MHTSQTLQNYIFSQKQIVSQEKHYKLEVVGRLLRAICNYRFSGS